MPSRDATIADVFGIETSVLQVATLTRPMSAGGRAPAAGALAACPDRHVGHRLVRPRVPAADDADPAADPFVTGVDPGREVVVGHHVGGLITAERDNPRSRGGRERTRRCHTASLG